MSTKIDFKQPFSDAVNEKATFTLMKKHLLFLSKNAFLLDEDMDTTDQYVEDEGAIMDYVNYTKSVIELHATTSAPSHSTKLIDAIARKDEDEGKRRRSRMERKARCGWILQGIMRLNEKEKMILIYRYMQDQSKEAILAKYKNLSISSYYRLHHRACLHLASILDLEIYQDIRDETLFSYQNNERKA